MPNPPLTSYSTCILAVFAFACNAGSPGASTTETAASDSVEPSTSTESISTESTSTDPTTGSSSTGTDAPTGADTGDPDSHPICERYLVCIAAVAPGALPGAQMGFGSDGTCWQGSASDAQLCLDACMAGLEDYNETFPNEEKCRLCQAHSECDMAAGELCHLGKCEVTTCGDGIVHPEEMCDSQPNCDPNCQGPQSCNPMSDHGCADSEGCRVEPSLVQEAGYAICREQNDPLVPEDAPCGNDLCQLGLGCALTELYPACDAKGELGCCAPYCDLGKPTPCAAGRTCVPYQEVFLGVPLVPELGFLGVCVPA